MKIPYPAIYYQSQPALTNCSPFSDKTSWCWPSHISGPRCVMRTPRQCPPKLGRAHLFAHRCFCVLNPQFRILSPDFVLLRVCSALFRKDPLHILVLSSTPHPSGHLGCGSLPSTVPVPALSHVCSGWRLEQYWIYLDIFDYLPLGKLNKS